MSGIGFWELIILFLIGLIVLGPERLPRVANQLGGWLGQARRMTRVMKRQLEDELNFEKDFDIKPPSREPSKQPESATPLADEFSPQHETDEPGTGVGDDDDELAIKGADQKPELHAEKETPPDAASDAEKKETS